MESIDQVVIEQLCNENPRFRLLYEEHLLLEKELEKLDQKAYLAPDEEVERKKIQKMKLAGKDEMELIVRKCKQ